MADDNKPLKPAWPAGRYMRYAIGEIVLVVIGILIALQINTWNEYRKDRIEEQTLYKTLISSLESDLKDVNSKLIVIENAIKAQELFIENSPDDINAKYNLSQISSMLMEVSLGSLSFFPNYGLYNQILNNNQIDLIQSHDMQLKIMELYEQYYERYHDLDLSLEHQYQFSFYINYNSKIIETFIKNNRAFKIKYDVFKSHYDELNAECRKVYLLTTAVREAMLDCRDHIESLISSLRNELK